MLGRSAEKPMRPVGGPVLAGSVVTAAPSGRRVAP